MELLTFSIRSSDVDTQDENTYSCICAQNAHERYRFARCLPANAARFPPYTRRSPPVRSGRRLPSMQKRAAKSLVTSATFRCTPYCEQNVNPLRIDMRFHCGDIADSLQNHCGVAVKSLRTLQCESIANSLRAHCARNANSLRAHYELTSILLLSLCEINTTSLRRRYCDLTASSPQTQCQLIA